MLYGIQPSLGAGSLCVRIISDVLLSHYFLRTTIIGAVNCCQHNSYYSQILSRRGMLRMVAELINSILRTPVPLHPLLPIRAQQPREQQRGRAITGMNGL